MIGSLLCCCCNPDYSLDWGYSGVVLSPFQIFVGYDSGIYRGVVRVIYGSIGDLYLKNSSFYDLKSHLDNTFFSSEFVDSGEKSFSNIIYNYITEPFNKYEDADFSARNYYKKLILSMDTSLIGTSLESVNGSCVEIIHSCKTQVGNYGYLLELYRKREMGLIDA
ncbi:MAG TPA: hypothetical protein VLZ29_06115 [Sulfurimonas sp.]|uniref:hypothetical protein n=1 Tax=Sulfurimonas sp. TaxID=2022749 RepID=UPI002C3C7FE9|nr:hypothetical protein [Sulfurimonas sp.]HUH42674.1 hypothetical protein [Sulfurimonas sp.]